MFRRAIAAISVFTVLAVTASADDKPVHVFILSGQSNMAGMNPKAGFEQEAAKLFPDAEVPYIKVAQGGRPIRLWVEQWNEIAKKHGLNSTSNGTVYYEPILKQFRAIIEKHPQPASVTFCWMQGERDAREKLSAAYEEALGTLISNLRRDLKQPEMNFVIGRLSDFGTDAEWEAVRKAQVSLAGKDPRGAWVDCDDLNDKEKDGKTRNDLHYTKAGYELLGRRYVRQAKALIEGRKPAADGRPE
ncbi:acetyl xylan esterase [bacterium]|nr:acetyl xylan esterase [bacterium]